MHFDYVCPYFNRSTVCFTMSYSSPDSDDTYFGDDSEEGRDDQYLVSDRCESKFYGSVHGGSTAGSTAAVGGFSAASANITRSIKVNYITIAILSERFECDDSTIYILVLNDYKLVRLSLTSKK